MNKLVMTLYRIGLIKAAAVTGYHFFLPTHFNWQRGLDNTPDILSWSLMTLNFDWSMITFLFAILLFWFSFSAKENSIVKRQVAAVYAIFWVSHLIYIFTHPTPFPASLAWIGQLFLGFGSITTILLLLGWKVFSDPELK